jgi:hypothetical protein
MKLLHMTPAYAYNADPQVDRIVFINGGGNKSLRNVGIIPFIYTVPSRRKRIQITLEPLCEPEISFNIQGVSKRALQL